MLENLVGTQRLRGFVPNCSTTPSRLEILIGRTVNDERSPAKLASNTTSAGCGGPGVSESRGSGWRSVRGEVRGKARLTILQSVLERDGRGMEGRG